jgi:hypothetical protein
VNPLVRCDALNKCVRKGTHPNAIKVANEMNVKGEWQHTSANTAFALNDAEYFMNTSRDVNGMIQTNLHFHFPAMHVTIEQALFMREALLHMLSVDDLSPLGWADALPTQSYTTAVTTCTNIGLRVLGANKTMQCTQCRKRSRDDIACTVSKCKQGKIDLKMPFRFIGVFVDGVLHIELQDHYHANLILLLKRCSIRNFLRDPSPNWKRFDGCPQYGDIVKKSEKSGEDTVYKMKGNRAVYKDKMSYGTNDLVDVWDRDIWKIFERHIQKDFDRRHHAHLRVTAVRFSSAKKIYFINVDGVGKHWCLNLLPPADHENSTIYFQCCFTQKGICARCRCSDPSTEGRHKGMCSKYHSTYKRLSPNEVTRVFL